MLIARMNARDVTALTCEMRAAGLNNCIDTGVVHGNRIFWERNRLWGGGGEQFHFDMCLLRHLGHDDIQVEMSSSQVDIRI